MRTFIFFLTTCSMAYGIGNILDELTWQDFNWCTHRLDDFVFGEFNGDNRDDVLCHHKCDSELDITFSQYPHGYEPVDSSMRFRCSESPYTQRFIGDFNGDNREDLLCISHRPHRGQLEQYFALPDGTFGESVRTDFEFCSFPGRELHIGDFNGDKRYDLLCLDTIYGTVLEAKADVFGRFDESTVRKFRLYWCYGIAMKMYIGKFNNDERDDMICHDESNGLVYITLANEDGSFGELYEAAEDFCLRNDQHLYTGDFNADGRDDLLCHDMHTGYVWIRLADESGIFEFGDWEGDLSFCKDFGQLDVANIDGDNIADLVCRIRWNPEQTTMYVRTTSPEVASEIKGHP